MSHRWVPIIDSRFTLEKIKTKKQKMNYDDRSIKPISKGHRSCSFFYLTDPLFLHYRMSIIGQFNRGFILVTLLDHSSQLFIVDQHAADEIYNFHRLYDNTTVSRQPLLHPKPIPLDPSRQVLLQQHLDLFNRLGCVDDERSTDAFSSSWQV